MITKIIADSSSLILLTKCRLIETVCELFELVVPSAVVLEVLPGKVIKNYPDAATISELISNGSITVENTGSDELPLPLSIHQGEKDALLLAMRYKGAVLATDDGKAIKAARFLKVPFIITPRIVTELFRIHKISLQKARNSIEHLGKIGRYSPEILADALLSLIMEGKDV